MEKEEPKHSAFEPFLFCIKCKRHFPSFTLKQMEGIVIVDINCRHCKQEYHLPLREYLVIIKQQQLKAAYCTSSKEHSMFPSVSYCFNCSKWLCSECDSAHSSMNHLRLLSKVVINCKCPLHEENSIEYYCEDCDDSFCLDCIDSHQMMNHSLLTKDILLKPIHSLNLETLSSTFEAILKKNASAKDYLLKCLDDQGDLTENRLAKVQSSFELNQAQNNFINELLLIAFSNLRVLAQFPLFDLMNNIKRMLEVNPTEPKAQGLPLSEECICLINYFQTNFSINIKQKVVNPDGETYEGELVNGLKEGYGVCKWSNGEQYSGQWKSGKRHGHGLMLHSNGNTYEGEWVDDKKEGYGVYKWPSGAEYKGHYKDDLQHGNGMHTYGDGDAYHGEFAFG